MNTKSLSVLAMRTLLAGVVAFAVGFASAEPLQAQPPASTAAPAAGGGAGDASELEELRREVRHLKAQMQMVKSAITEAAELDKMSSGALLRALKVMSDVPSAQASEGGAASGVRGAGAGIARSLDSGKGSAGGRGAAASGRRAPVAAPPEPTANVRGKVEIPEGEPAAFVFVENVRGPAVNTKVTIEQVRKQFVPAWAVVQRGTTVEFPNLDNIFHNVFSLSTGNNFDLGLYSSAKSGKGHRFMEAGGVDIYCNIHPQMAAGVLVVPSRHFAQVKADGTFELPDVPAGRRKIVAWSPGSRLAGTWVDASEGETVAVNLRLERKSGRHKRKDGRPYAMYE